MNGVNPPEKLCLRGNLDVAWREFRQRFEIYIRATNQQDAEPERLIALLLHSAGPAAIEIFNSFVLEDVESKDYKLILKKFEEHCSPQRNEIFERYVFQKRTQHEGEPVEKFSADLKILAKSCNFGELKDSLIRDQIVFGLFNKKMTERLLRVKNLTLEDSIRLAQAQEITQTQMAQLGEGGNKDNSQHTAIDQVRKTKKYKDFNKTKKINSPKDQKEGGQSFRNKCQKCGYTHDRGRCYAYGKLCYACGKNNHFSKLCKNKNGGKINVVESNYEDLQDALDDFRIDIIESDSAKEEWFLPIKINNNVIKFKLDTGAQMDVIPYDVYNKLKPRPNLKPNKTVLTGYSNSIIKTYGCFTAKIMFKKKSIESTVAVTEGKRIPILGLKSCDSLGLVRKVYHINTGQSLAETNSNNIVLNKYKNLFKGIGCVKQKHTIRLKPGSIPVIQAPRRIAFAMRSKLKNELERMIKLGIIKKIETPTDWVNSLVIVEKKDGALRICLDPKNLNECIRREHFQIPTRDEIESELAGAKYFSKLDMQSGFYQVPLDEESAKLCTFNTPFGRHCFLRLPFGISSAPEVFQKTVNGIFEGLEGVRVYIDDIIIWGSSKEEHNKRLLKALQRAEEAGVTLNKSKCCFAQEELTFLGEHISKNGISPDKSQTEDILKMKTPVDKSEVRSMLGMINYLGKYIPHLSQKTSSLRSLTKEGTVWEWGPEHDRELDDIKLMLIGRPILQFYDPKKQIKVSTDASGFGLGAVLLQLYGSEWKPVTYASRTLTEVETRYAQIEKETLGLVYGCERFHDYIYGRKFLLETDHKPLLAMTKRNIAEIPPRIQRLFLRLLRYQFTLQHVPGKQLVIADTLSRMVPKEAKSKGNTDNDVQIHINTIIKTLPVGDQMLEKIRIETAKDEEMQQIRTQLGKNANFRELAKPYQKHRNDLSEYQGLLLKGTRIMIPKSLRKEILKKIHEGHMGVEKNKRRARESVYWNNINSDIKMMVERCVACQINAKATCKEPLMQTEIVQRPWYQIGTDLFKWKGKDHIVIMDYYSNYPVVVKLKNTTAGVVINCLKNIFSMFGIPNTVVSDNGPPFSSREFKEFMLNDNFIHRTSSPRYPQSNGLAEKAVQIVKNIMTKCNDEEDVHLGFMAYRGTPLEGRPSPAELMMKRKIRTTMPLLVKTKPRVSPHKNKQKFYYDLHAKTRSDLKVDDTVRLREPATGTWPLKAIVKEQLTPRSFRIETETGVKLRRNTRHLRKTKEIFKKIPEDLENETVIEQKPHVINGQVDAPAITLRRSSRIRKPPNRLDL